MALKNYFNSLYDIKYNIVLITKNNEPILTDEIAKACSRIIQEVCLSNNVEIEDGIVKPNYVKLVVMATPQTSIGKVIKLMKFKTTKELFEKFDSLESLNHHLWQETHFVSSIGEENPAELTQFIEGFAKQNKANTLKIEL